MPCSAPENLTRMAKSRGIELTPTPEGSPIGQFCPLCGSHSLYPLLSLKLLGWFSNIKWHLMVWSHRGSYQVIQFCGLQCNQWHHRSGKRSECSLFTDLQVNVLHCSLTVRPLENIRNYLKILMVSNFLSWVMGSDKDIFKKKSSTGNSSSETELTIYDHWYQVRSQKVTIST